ncbi:MAG: cyclase family protein [Bryobacterales bacterium]|nr:cyclase family protein [Bryobacterales bacterium]
MLIKLSYNLSEHTPFYASLPKPQLRQIYDLEKGDACNSFYLTTSNHCGTHVDAPRHFNPQGRSITDYDLAEFVFDRPTVADMPLRDRELVTPSHLEPALAQVPPTANMLLLRTGFGAHREDERRYIDQGPGFGPEAAEFLMSRFPSLRAIAMDFPSVSALAHEEAGAEAHRVFLGCGAYSKRPILLVEDANLPEGLPPLKRVFIMPWLVDGLDSAPCTMYAEVGEHA